MQMWAAPCHKGIGIDVAVTGQKAPVEGGGQDIEEPPIGEAARHCRVDEVRALIRGTGVQGGKPYLKMLRFPLVIVVKKCDIG